MTDKFKTYVITNPSSTSLTFSLGSTGLTGYDGFLYLLMGSGGPGGTVGGISYGGSSGYINSGYIDLNYPYNVRDITVKLNPASITTLSVGYTGPNYDPTNGASDFVLLADQGQSCNIVTSPTTGYRIAGLYGPSNGFSSQSVGGNPYLINQRGIDSSGGPDGPLNGQGGMTNDFCQYQSSPEILGGGGFYGGTLGPTGPFGFSSGSWFSPPTGTNGTLGYAIITLIPSLSVQSTVFATGGGNTGTIGNSGIYLYSLLGGGAAGYGGGGGGSGDTNFGFINSSNSLQYTIGEGGITTAIGGKTSFSEDNYTLTEILASGGSNSNADAGSGFFAGGTPNQNSGISYINLPSNITQSYIVNGAGFVNASYGQGNPGTAGGGGGPYGGNYNTNAQGYGCGGGGTQTNGSDGYAILKKMIPNSFTYKYITSNTIITQAELFGYVGFWGFLESPFTITQLDISRNYFNIFHFLIKEDNVQTIDVIKDTNNYFNVSISFSKLNNKIQQFNMKATHPSSYMYMIFYV
jgi:hypothetical protein